MDIGLPLFVLIYRNSRKSTTKRSRTGEKCFGIYASTGSRDPDGAAARRLKIRGRSADISFVERRFDHRHLTGLGLTAAQVRVTDLAKPDRSGEGHMTDISASGMGMVVPFELSPGDILQLDIDDSRLFGFVMHAAAEGSSYRVGIELQRVLIGGTDLSRLLRQTLQSALPELPGVVGTLRA